MSDTAILLRGVNNRLVAGMQVDTYHEMQVINRAANEIDDLTKKLEVANERITKLLSFTPTYCPEGVDPTFYFTLTYAGDKEIQDSIDSIKAATKEEE